MGVQDRGERRQRRDARRYSQERKPGTEVTPPRERAPRRRIASPVGSTRHEKQQDFMVAASQECTRARARVRAAVASDPGPAEGQPNPPRTARKIRLNNCPAYLFSPARPIPRLGLTRRLSPSGPGPLLGNSKVFRIERSVQWKVFFFFGTRDTLMLFIFNNLSRGKFLFFAKI